jgi:hypothetical protein
LIYPTGGSVEFKYKNNQNNLLENEIITVERQELKSKELKTIRESIESFLMNIKTNIIFLPVI